MNIEIARALQKYSIVLYKSNQKLLEIFGVRLFNEYNDGTENMISIIQNIPRLIPYSYDDKKKALYLFDETGKEDGLLEYKNELDGIRDDFNKILNNNSNGLTNVKKIRIKCEHQIHNVKLISRTTGTKAFFIYEFKLKNKVYLIKSNELIELFKDLNILYNKLIKTTAKLFYNNELHYSSLNTMFNMDLLSFNRIYDNELLWDVGNAFRRIQ